MCKIYTIANSKGGIGKSFSTQTIGVILHQKGYKVLCIDTDTQGHLAVSFSVIPEQLPFTLTDLAEAYIKQEPISKEMVQQAIIKTNTVDLLPSTFAIDKLEVGLNSINDREYFLQEVVDLIKDDYDMIIADCNSSRNIFTINALACATHLIIPSQSHFLSTEAIELMLSTVKSIKRRINPNLKVSGILLTMYQSNTIQCREAVETVRETYGDKVFKSIIPFSIKAPDSQKKGVSIIELDKNNPVSIAYKELVEELLYE
jgi:chromosome partitioning protein